MSTPQHIVCVFERGTLGVIGRYATEGEAARAMRGAGPTAHVVVDGELSKTHHAMSGLDERRIERALDAGTHPALPLARYAVAPTPAPVEPPAPAAPAEPPAPVEAAHEEQPAADEPEAEEEPAGPSLDEVAELVAQALRSAGTQRALAAAIGTSGASLSMMARGQRAAPAGVLEALRAYVASPPTPPPQPAREGASLLERAAALAGSMPALAKALGRDLSALYRARQADHCSPALAEALRAYVEGPSRVEAPAEPAADEEPEEALAPEAEAPRAAPVEAEAKQPAPRVLHVPARAPAGADSAVTLRLEREDAARLYRLLAGSGEQALRLALADALLGAA